MNTTTPVAPALNKPSLSLGRSGTVVREAQQLLNLQIFPANLQVDGQFGPQMEAAVKHFQLRMFIDPIGVIGPQTWLTLFKQAPVNQPLLAKGYRENVIAKVRQLQDRLKKNALYAGQVDGDFGVLTEIAVKTLQQRVGLPVDGVMGDRDWFEVCKLPNL